MKKRNVNFFLLSCSLVFLTGIGFRPVHSSDQTVSTGEGKIGVELISSSEQGVSFHLSVPWESLKQESVQEEGRAYTSLSLPGWNRISQPGAPALPSRAVTIGVPFGAEVTVSVVTGNSRTITLDTPILPIFSQINDEALVLSQEGLPMQQVQTEILMDEDIYGTPDSYPGKLAEISSEGVMRGQRIVAVAIYPLQYQPAKNALTIYEELWIEIQFSGIQTQPSKAVLEENSVFDDILADTLLNYNEARFWQQPTMPQNGVNAGNLAWDIPSPAWKVIVNEEGMYQLDKGSLIQADFPVETLTPVNIQMFNQGQEVALDVRLDDQDQVESIFFYGQAIESKYTNQNVYWLTIGSEPGLRMTQRSGVPGAAEIPQTYRREIFADRLPTSAPIYIEKALGSDDLERFFMGNLATASIPTINYSFTLGTIVSNDSGLLTVSLLGRRSDSSVNPDHHVTFYLNNILLGDVWFDGFTWQTVDLTIPIGLLQAGDNTLRFTCADDTGALPDVVYLDWFRITFSDSFTAVDEKLSFAYERAGTWRFEVSGFLTGTNVDVYDISDPLKPVMITGGINNSGMFSFQESIDSASSYEVLAFDQYLIPSPILRDSASNLRNPVNTADMIIISHAEFLEQSQDLADYRNGQGLPAVVVDVQDIYDEFNHGIVSPYAIREFLAFTQDNWQGTAPAYVLLVGDGHYDPKNFLGYNRPSYIPPFLGTVDFDGGETAADNRYVTFDGEGDLLPDMLIGRFSVNNSTEAAAMVAKIVAYETLTPASAEWQDQVLFIADDSAMFASTSNYMATNYVEASGHPATKVYQGVAPHETLLLARAAIQQEINAGKLFVNYIGHASSSQWADGGSGTAKGLLNLYDIAALTNEGTPPIVLGMTCREGYFIMPHPLNTNYDAVAEVFTRKPLGGALASWSASGAGVATGHFSLNAGFYEAYFFDGVGTLGEATLAGKLMLWQTGNALDLLDTYHLFGDPSIVFKRGLTAISDDYEMNENNILTVSAPGVLANDHNPGSLTLTAQLVDGSGPSHGTLELNQNGGFTYTPSANWYGLDSFYYQAVADGEELSNPTRVNIRVQSTNQPPIAQSDSYTAEEDSILTVSVLNGVLINDSDPDGDELTAHLFSNPAKGSVLFYPDGSFSYYPWFNQNGTDSFTYQAYDGEAFSDATIITINITPVNDTPLASPDSYTTYKNINLVVPAPGVLANDFDYDGDALTTVLVPGSGPAFGELTFNVDGSFNYTPLEGFAGEVSFSYRASDGFLESENTLVTITVEPEIKIFLPLILR